MATDIPNPTGAPDAGDRSPEPREILDFLGSAPDSIRDWADDLAAQVKAQAAELDVAKADALDDADAASPSAKVTTPADLRTEPVRFQQARRKGWHPSTVVLATLAVAALVFGVYWIGQPDEPVAADQAQMGAAQGNPAANVDMERLAELELALAEDPSDIDAHLEIGVMYFNLQELEPAEHHWTRVTQEDPENSMAWFNLGFLHLYGDEPDVEAAEAAWERLLEVAPDSAEADVVRSHMASMMGTDDPHRGMYVGDEDEFERQRAEAEGADEAPATEN